MLCAWCLRVAPTGIGGDFADASEEEKKPLALHNQPGFLLRLLDAEAVGWGCCIWEVICFTCISNSILYFSFNSALPILLGGKHRRSVRVKLYFTLCPNTFPEMRFKRLSMSSTILSPLVQQPNNYLNCFNVTCTASSIYLVGISFLFLFVSVACLLNNIWLCLMICTEDRAKWNISCLHQLQQLMHVNF